MALRAAAAALCATICTFATSEPTAAKAQYITIDIDGRGIGVDGINAKGFVVGEYADGAFIRSPGGRVTTFSIDGGENLFIIGINNNREIAGFYGTTFGQGFVRERDGTITTFDPSGADASFQAAEEEMHKDPRMDEAGDPPFDAKRLILGCFQPIFEMGR